MLLKIAYPTLKPIKFQIHTFQRQPHLGPPIFFGAFRLSRTRLPNERKSGGSPGLRIYATLNRSCETLGLLSMVRRHNAKIRWHRWAILDLQAVPSDRPVAGNAFKWVTTSTGCRLHPKCNDRYLAKISRSSYSLSSRTPVQRV